MSANVVAATLLVSGGLAWSELAHSQQSDGKAQKTVPKAGSKAVEKPMPKPAAKVGDKFGEWTYQCDEPLKGAAASGSSSCYLSQSRISTNESGEQSRVLLVNLSRLGPERHPALFIFLPFGSAVQQDVAVSIDGANAVFKGRVDTCLVSGCRVPFLLKDDVQDLLRKGKTIWVSFAPVAGNTVRVEVPLAGFSAGLSAIQ